MKILYVASEALPFAASGGLGDVMGSLPSAVSSCLGEGSDVRVIMPMYKSVKDKFGASLFFEREIYVPLAWRRQFCGIWSTERNGVKYYFLDNEFYFKRDSMYGSFDDGERFAFFCRAVLEVMGAVGFYPDILHANDWQSALSIIYLKRKYEGIREYSGIKTVYTIHNIEYQGRYGFDILGDVFDLYEWDRGIVEYDGDINLSKGAIALADRVTTVSRRYAEEIMNPYYAHGLSHILESCRYKLSGIVNGIDTDYYNPETDPDIHYHFSAKSLAGKAKNKLELQKKCGFEPDKNVPVVAMISRLVAHKGFDLVCRIIDELLAADNIQFVLLGTGESDFEQFFRGLSQRHPDRCCAMIEFNKELSKQIYAGADMFLMPSKSEPCGLSQMIASRYGTVPIVRETGGLYDTIHAYNEYDGSGNGFSFANYNAHEMMATVRYAESIFADRKRWNALVCRVMGVDFSWSSSARQYVQLYESML